MAKNRDDTWELAVSVNKDHQLRGIGGRLIEEMISFSKFNKITEVWMNCIEGNRIIQHLATKNELTTKHRGDGERTATIKVPEPTLIEANEQLWKEQAEVFKDMGRLQAISEVYMHCINENKAIQHLALKNELTTKHRGQGERTSTIKVPEPTIIEANEQLWKEQAEVFKDMGRLQAKLGKLWVKPILPK